MISSWPRRAVAFVFNNRILVFLMPALLTRFWDGQLHFHPTLAYYAMVTLFTMASYIQNMLTDVEEDAVNYPSGSRLFHARSRWGWPVVGACMVASAVIAARTGGWRFMGYATLVNCAGFLYGVHVRLPWRGRTVGFRVKSVPGLKNAYAAFFWSVLLLVTPYVHQGQVPPAAVGFPILVSFLILFSMELAWDVRDQPGDVLAGVSTLPLLFGEGASRGALQALNALILLLLVAGYLAHLMPPPYLVVLSFPLAAVPFWQWYFRARDRQVGAQLYLLLFSTPMAGAVALVGS